MLSPFLGKGLKRRNTPVLFSSVLMTQQESGSEEIEIRKMDCLTKRRSRLWVSSELKNLIGGEIKWIVGCLARTEERQEEQTKQKWQVSEEVSEERETRKMDCLTKRRSRLWVSSELKSLIGGERKWIVGCLARTEERQEEQAKQKWRVSEEVLVRFWRKFRPICRHWWKYWRFVEDKRMKLERRERRYSMLVWRNLKDRIFGVSI